MQLSKTSLLNLINKVGGFYYKLEDLTDSSGGARTLTNNGSTPFNPAKYGNGADFGASNTTKYLSRTDAGGMANGAWTVGCWFNCTTAPGTGVVYTLIGSQLTTTNMVDILFNYQNSGGTKQIDINRSKNGVANQDCTYNIDLGTGSWHHIVGVYDGSANLYLYLDGVLVATLGSVSGNGTASGSTGFGIGSNNAGGSLTSGIIDDAFGVNIALTAQQVAEIYNTDATTLGLANTNSLGFRSASSQYVSIANAASLQITGALTIEAWVKTTNTSTEEIISKGVFDNAADADYGLSLGSGALVGFVSNGTSSNNTTGVANIADGQWHHVAMVYIPSTSLTVYVDGKLDQQITTSIVSSIQSTTHVLIIGADTNATRQFDGKINDVRLFSVAKTAAQIQADMANSTLLFTTNLVSRWKLNSSSGTTATDSVGSNNGTLTNYTSGFEGWSGDVPYAGNTVNYASLALASTNSEAVSITDASNLKPTTALTIEAWIKTLSSGANQIIFASYSQNTNPAGFMFYVTSGGKLGATIGRNTGLTDGTDYFDSSNLISTASVNDGTWHHVALTFDSTTARLFIDGVADGTYGFAHNVAYAATNYVRIGAQSNSGTNLNFFNGKIENVRLWNVARVAADILANKSASVIGTSGLVTEWRTQNQGLDQTAMVSGGNSSANNITTFTNNPVFITDVPFANYLTTISITDTGSGVDTVTVGPNTIPVIDTASGVDAISILETLVPLTETATGVDAVSALPSFTVPDTALGVDVVSSQQTALIIADTASGIDALSLFNIIPITDTGAGVDVVAILDIIIKQAIHGFNKSIGFNPTYSPRNNTYVETYKKQTF